MGYGAPASSDHYVKCFPLRMVAAMFCYTSTPHGEKAPSYRIGPADASLDVRGAMWCPGMLACAPSSAHTIFHALWPDGGGLERPRPATGHLPGLPPHEGLVAGCGHQRRFETTERERGPTHSPESTPALLGPTLSKAAPEAVCVCGCVSRAHARSMLDGVLSAGRAAGRKLRNLSKPSRQLGG